MLYAAQTHTNFFSLVAVFVGIMSPIFTLEVTGPFSAYAEGLPHVSRGITTCNILEATLQLSPSAS